MVTRQRIVSFGIPTLALGTIVTSALLHRVVQPAPPPDCIYPPRPAEPFIPVTSVPAMRTDAPRDRHHIDVVFAIDTTASMGSLIDGARRTVWGIADHIRKADPGADLRVGLVAYRDNDPEADMPEAYLTRPFALTTDLDAVYQELRGYDASGGWTQPENIAAGLWDALRMAWRPSATKLVFVVGDAEPADRGDVPGHATIIGEMVKRGIVVNAIQVGSLPATETAFRRMAQLGGGEYASTAQSGGVQQIATPYDAALAELEARITRTTVFVGPSGERAAWQGRMAAAEAAPAAAKADRAGYY
ncbi:MAG: VWA domain-containing protein, partial [Deltaproteobacteria bacterium]|nr:VWA domain-containing protein [Deltaproteobacteria bacterium]